MALRKKDRPIYVLQETDPISLFRLRPYPQEGEVIGHVYGRWGKGRAYVTDTSANLVSLNKVYLDNVLIIETDTGRAKLANGVDQYFDLPYVFNVTGAGLNGFAVNYAALPPAGTAPDQFWGVLNSQGTSWLPGSLGGTYYSKGIYYSDGATWSYLGSAPYQATQPEVDAGILQDNFVSPFTLANAAQWTTKNSSIQFQEATIDLGAIGTVDTINFEGNLTAVRVGNTLTITAITVSGLPADNVRFTDQEAAITGGLVQYDKYWLDSGSDVGVPGTLMMVL